MFFLSSPATTTHTVTVRVVALLQTIQTTSFRTMENIPQLLPLLVASAPWHTEWSCAQQMKPGGPPSVQSTGISSLSLDSFYFV